MSPARERNWTACDALAAPNGANCGARTRNRRRRPLLDLEFAVYREGVQVLRSSTRWIWHTTKACMHLRFAPSPRSRRHKYSIVLDADKHLARTHICPAHEHNFEVVPSAGIGLDRTVGIGYQRIHVGRSLMSPPTVAPSTMLSLRTAQTIIDCEFMTRPAPPPGKRPRVADCRCCGNLRAAQPARDPVARPRPAARHWHDDLVIARTENLYRRQPSRDGRRLQLR